MLARIEYFFFALFVLLAFTADARSQGIVASDRVVVSYPSKSITSFPILETAQRRGFFRRENLDVSAVYMRGGIDIKAVLTGDADFGTGSTTAVTAFVAGAPLRVVMSLNSYVDQALYAQPKYRTLAELKGQSIGSLNPGGLVDTLLRKVIVQNGHSPERDFILLNMGGTPERYAALKAGTLAASMLSAPHSLHAEKEGFTKIAATRDYVDVPGTALVAHVDKIKKQPEMIKRFLRATLRCYVDVKSHTRVLFFLKHSFASRPKRDLLPYVARHTGRHTSLQCALSKGTRPRALCLKSRTFRSCQSLPVLRNGESFPGAMSPLGSKEPNEPVLSRRMVVGF
jgi:ABC-type nitrate/sulfonate/bicarbonate transport system substrate-binding protein